MEPGPQVAIIGAGLSGLALALALHQQKITSILYESQSASLDIGGAIMLSPNALQILDALKVLPRLEPRSYKFDKLYFRSKDDQIVDDYEFGSVAKYGYPGFRVYRFELIGILLGMLQEAGIPIQYGKKFQNVVSETPDGVRWRFADGSEAAAAMLVGADGIHSAVRLHLDANAKPKFTNMMGITAAVPTSQLQAPDGYLLPVTIMHPELGAFVMAPQLPDGSEMLIGRQFRFDGPEPDRQRWKDMAEDKRWSAEYLRRGNDGYPAIVGRASSSIDLEKINFWPFYVVPKLEAWSSSAAHNRVVILGDAAHAIPPSAGQGVNQAFEDVFTFSRVVGKLGIGAGRRLDAALRNWQRGRQARVDRVLELNERINKRRVSTVDEIDTQPFELDWLYGVDVDKMVNDWVSTDNLAVDDAR